MSQQTISNDSYKCEACKAKFTKKNIVENYNEYYDLICLKCASFIEERQKTICSTHCSNSCLKKGVCDGSC